MRCEMLLEIEKKNLMIWYFYDMLYYAMLYRDI